MEFLCIFIPAMILCLVRRKLLKIGTEENSRVINLILEYAIACVAINFFFQLFIVSVYTKVTDISKYLNHNITFSLKYLLSASAIAIIIPCIEKYVRNNFEIEVSYPEFKFNFQECFLKIATFFNRIEEFLSEPKIQKIFYVFVVLIVLLVCGINIMRIYDNALWLDEMKTVGASQFSFSSMLNYVVKNGHSPLHYIFAWNLNKIINITQDYHYFYLYHLTALLPWIITIIVGIAFVKKWFGNVASLIFLVCASLLHSSIYIALEVRMYSLCQLFVLMTFLATYKCYKIPKTLNFILFSVFAICAIYSHYFALPVVSIMYFIMFVHFYLYNRMYLKELFMSSIFIIVALLPWIILMYKTQKTLISNYGLKSIAGISSCFHYIFDSDFSWILFIIFVTVAFIVINRNFNLITIQYFNGRHNLKINFNNINFKNTQTVWMISGVLAVLGMIIGALLFSCLFFPIITTGTLRYFLSAFVILWLLLGVFVQQLHRKNLIVAIIVILLIISGMPRVINVYNEEMQASFLHIQTLEAINKIIEPNNFVITDQKHLEWGFLSEYYLGIDKKRVIFIDKQENLIPKINDKYLLILKKPIEDKFRKEIYKKGYKLNTIKEHGLIGNLSSNIYQLEKTKNYKGDQK